MSKASQKRRAAARAAGKRGRFESWSRESLLSLLTAAACSPSAAHRLPSIGRTLQDAVRLKSSGTDIIGPESLGNLLDATKRADPRVGSLEDYVPLNPLMRVRVRHRGRRYRLHPAGLERPIAAVVRARRVADAVDDTLLRLEGFGIADLLELVLRFADRFIEVCSSFWPNNAVQTLDAPATVTAAEIMALKDLVGLEDIAAQCTHPDRARLALRWGTREAQDLHFEPDGDTLFGTVIAVRLASGELWPMPPPLQMEALFGAVSVLARRASESSDADACEARFHDTSTRVALQSLGLGGRHSPSRSGGDRTFSAILPITGRHWLAVEIVSSLTGRGLQAYAQSAAERLASARPGARYGSTSGNVARPPHDAVIARLMIASLPGHIGFMSGPTGIARMSLDDLEWVAFSADDPHDIFLFAREFADPPSVNRLMVLETINAWEVWRHNGKAFHRAGTPYHFMMLGAHEGDVEWKTSAEQEDLEEALFILGLPEIRDWTKVTLTGRRARLRRDGPLEGWLFGRGTRVVALRLFAEDVPVSERVLLDNVGEALLWTLERVEPHAAPFFGSTPRSIVFEYVRPSGDAPLRYSAHPAPDTFTISWSSDLWELEAGNAGTIERLLRTAVLNGARAISTPQTVGFMSNLERALASAPPAFSMALEKMYQRHTDLPKPQKPHATFLSETLRALASHMRTLQVPIGEHSDAAAVQLETEIIYPFLKSLLIKEWDRFDGESVLETLACELECAAYWRTHRRRALQDSIRNVELAYDPVTQATENDQEDGSAERRLELLIELALAHPPKGRLSLDQLELRRLLSISQLSLESGFRGEGAHYRLMPSVTKISDMYEVTTQTDGEPPIDWEAFHRSGYQDAVQATSRNREPDVEEDAASKPAGIVTPRFAAIDDSMKASYGFSVVCFIGVIRALTTWPVSGSAPIARASLDQAVAHVEPLLDFPVMEVRAAIEALVLRGEALRAGDIEPWEFAKRPARLITQPLIQVSETDILILPWFLEKVLSIYMRYLADCRLPWPKASTHQTVQTALESYRQSMNEMLEANVADRLQQHGLKVRKRVKKPHVLGLASLSGEIDCVAIDEQSGTLWVLEVKDPEEVFSVADISRSVRRFHDPKGWLDKLAKKVEDVERDPKSVARALGAKGDSWRIRAAVVTRRAVPAGFLRASRFPFTSLGHIVEFVSELALTRSLM